MNPPSAEVRAARAARNKRRRGCAPKGRLAESPTLVEEHLGFYRRVLAECGPDALSLDGVAFSWEASLVICGDTQAIRDRGRGERAWKILTSLEDQLAEIVSQFGVRADEVDARDVLRLCRAGRPEENVT